MQAGPHDVTSKATARSVYSLRHSSRLIIITLAELNTCQRSQWKACRLNASRNELVMDRNDFNSHAKFFLRGNVSLARATTSITYATNTCLSRQCIQYSTRVDYRTAGLDHKYHARDEHLFVTTMHTIQYTCRLQDYRVRPRVSRTRQTLVCHDNTYNTVHL